MTSEFLQLWETEKESSGLAIFPLHVIIPAKTGRTANSGRGRTPTKNDAIAVASMRRASSYFPKPKGRRKEVEKETGNGAKNGIGMRRKKGTGGRVSVARLDIRQAS